MCMQLHKQKSQLQEKLENVAALGEITKTPCDHREHQRRERSCLMSSQEAGL